MLSIRKRLGDGNLLWDLIAILLVLAVGIGGQLILSNPLKVFAPKLPMLSIQDWTGSQVTVDLEILDGWSWREKREFHQRLARVQEATPVAEASQRLIWYAAPTQPAAEWNRHLLGSYNEQQLVAKSLSKDKPVSLLFCSDASEDSRECTYIAYWRHWYTEVTIWSRTEADLPLSERKQLTERIDALLMSAPDIPCRWMFCPGNPPKKVNE